MPKCNFNKVTKNTSGQLLPKVSVSKKLKMRDEEICHRKRVSHMLEIGFF